MVQSQSVSGFFRLSDHRCVESAREPAFLAVVLRAFPEARPPNASATMGPEQHPIAVFTVNILDKKILCCRDITLHAQNLSDVRNPARAVAQTLRLNDDVDRGADHLADGLGGKCEAAHQNH